MRVLVLEDYHYLREVMTALLESKGHDVVAAGTATEALTALGDGDIDAAILDVHVPWVGTQKFGAHGVAVARQAARRGVPCLVMSADAVVLSYSPHPTWIKGGSAAPVLDWLASVVPAAVAA